MRGFRGVFAVWVAALLVVGFSAPAQVKRARVVVDVGQKAPHRISKYLTGKFAEHLGSNIYNGMSAQIVRNPTFADFPFGGGEQTPDGRPRFLSGEEEIERAMRNVSGRLNWPPGDVDRLVEGRKDALAFWWFKIGERARIKTSPDVSGHGRAQRIEVTGTGGIAQWMYLPLHRVRTYQYELRVRAPEAAKLVVALTPLGAGEPAGQSVVEGIEAEWKTIRGALEVPAAVPADALCRLSITCESGGHFVIARALLYPSDHIETFDPDVVRLLKESRLPVLRWPGGNFVSGYRWERGVGPIDQRPTETNWGWGGVEPNLFGTEEFIAFCRAVGCEPMICVNAGDGTPEEAARWVEYCNGAADTPMGAKRTANGHRAPFNVRLWEAGNEIWGGWQVHWTTPAGNVDRWKQFSAAMLKADPSMTLYACGAPVHWGRDWNRALIREAKPQRTTDHPLIGGSVPLSAEPLEVYQSFMGVPEALGKRWGELRDQMIAVGIDRPRLGITELQLFARLGARPPTEDQLKLRNNNLVTPATQAEALYDVLMYHTAIGLLPFVDLVTQSATVNHGGGLRKDRERVFANPCHYAQSAFSAFNGATPVRVELEGPTERVANVLPDMRPVTREYVYTTISPVAAMNEKGELLISLVNRSKDEAVAVEISVKGFGAGREAELWSLGAEVPWAANTSREPQRVKPEVSKVPVRDGVLRLEMRPYTLVQITAQTDPG